MSKNDRRLDIDDVPDGHYIVEVRDWEEVLVEADTAVEAREKAFEGTKFPNPIAGRVARCLPPNDSRRQSDSGRNHP